MEADNPLGAFTGAFLNRGLNGVNRRDIGLTRRLPKHVNDEICNDGVGWAVHNASWHWECVW
jgi:hypothetical protein